MRPKATYWISKSGKKYPYDEYGNNGGGRTITWDGKVTKDLPDDYPYTLEFEEHSEEEKANRFIVELVGADPDENRGAYPEREMVWIDDKKDENGKVIIKEGYCSCPIPLKPKDEIEGLIEKSLGLAKTSDKRLAKACANWLTGPVKAHMKKVGYEHHSPIKFFHPIKLKELAIYVEFTDFIDFGEAKRKVFPRLIDNFGDETIFDIMDDLGLWAKLDDNEVEQLIDDVLSKLPEEVERFKNGEEKLFGMFMGQIMRNKGKMAFNAKDVNALLRKRLMT